MRKLWIIPILIFVLFLWGDKLQLGNQRLKKPTGAIISSDTVAPGETLWTAVYNISGTNDMSSYCSMAFDLDSLRDSIYCKVFLEESHNGGTTYDLQTLLTTISFGGANVDTTIAVSLFPTPDFRLGWLNAGSGTDSFTVDDVEFLNHRR